MANDGPLDVDSERCAICTSAVGVGRALQLLPVCGHRVHYTCLRDNGFTGDGELACKSCGATGKAFLDVQQLRRLHREATPYLRSDAPSDLEMMVNTELSLGYSVTPFLVVPDVVFRFEGLRCLDFTGHPISTLPPAIGKMQSLRRLVLNSLNLLELPDEICDLVWLEQLFLYGNHIRALPSKWGQLNRLWRMCLDSNRIEKLPETLPWRLDALEVSGNRLTCLPESICSSERLSELRALGNELVAIPESVCRMEHLRDIFLQGNRLRSIPQDLSRLQSLRILCLSDNCLEHIPDSVCDLQAVEWLYLYNNRLLSLPQDITWKMRKLDRFLVERNPLTDIAAAALLSSVPGRLSVLGVDADQVASARRAPASVSGCDLSPELPANVSIGWMLPWYNLYAKLAPVSQLRGRVTRGNEGSKWLADMWSASPMDVDEESGGPSLQNDSFARRDPADVLVVAFSASQAMPEWMKILGQIINEGPVCEARASVSRSSMFLFHEEHVKMHGVPPSEGQEGFAKAAATLWQQYCSSDFYSESAAGSTKDGARLRDYDVLSLCDSHAQWYLDSPQNQLGLREKLEALTKEYKRVLFLGASMGGFAALYYADLADTVAVFAPQTNLCKSHLRPGTSTPSELVDASRALRESVQRAVAKGTRIDYHVSMEDHLVYAKELALPFGSMIVHPIQGRTARLLERAGILGPLLIGLIADLQDAIDVGQIAEPTRCADPDVRDRSVVKWDWSDKEEQNIVVAKWKFSGGCSYLRATPWELLLITQEAPSSGDWYCGRCSARNDEYSSVCRHCIAGVSPRNKIAVPWHLQDWKLHMCGNCGTRQRAFTPCCQLCGGVLQLACAECGRMGLEGQLDVVTKQWNCSRCWSAFNRLNQDMRYALPPNWYVEGGQTWSWIVDEVHRCSICFMRQGQLQTSLGEGAWWVSNETMEVSFGKPAIHWRLTRTQDGFTATFAAMDKEAPPPLGFSSLRVSGKPLYGSATAIDVRKRPAWCSAA